MFFMVSFQNQMLSGHGLFLPEYYYCKSKAFGAPPLQYFYMSMRRTQKKYMFHFISPEDDHGKGSMSKNGEAFSLYFKKPSLTLLLYRQSILLA